MNIEIPEIYQTAIEKALQVDGVTVSTLKVKGVLANLPDTSQDFISAQFYTKEYKRQNKRVPKLTLLLNACSDALKVIEMDSNEFNQLASAVALFAKPEISEDEF